MGSHYADGPGHASVALAGDVDWEAMRQERISDKLEMYDEFHATLGTLEKPDDSTGEIFDADGPRGENCRAAFESRQDYARASTAAKKTDSSWMPTFDKLAQMFYSSRDEYAELFQADGLTFGFVDLEGGWNERGDMGWWGCVDEDAGTPSYDRVFWEFVRSLDDDQVIYVVDCHI